MTTLWPIETIFYSRKPFARGVILGKRKFRSELARTQKPCQLCTSDGIKISFLTPHKRDFLIFAPADDLQAGSVLTWLTHDDKSGKTVERRLVIVEKSLHHVLVDVQSEQERIFEKRRFKKRPWRENAVDFDPFAPDMPFLPDSVLAARKYQARKNDTPISDTLIAPEYLIHAGKKFRRKTNFCFIFAPEKKRVNGSIWQRVQPESIECEGFFRYYFELYDLLTGRKVETDLQTTRKVHLAEIGKVSPQWRATA